MWLKFDGVVIDDFAPFTDAVGTAHPGNVPKADILYPDDYWQEPLRGKPQLVYISPPVLTEEDIAVQLEENKQRAWERIKDYRQQRQHAGVQVGEKWFNSDADTRIQQLGLFAMGQSMPLGIPDWKTLDNSFVPMTPNLAAQIFMATAHSDIAIFAVAEQHKAAMEISADPLAYDYKSGWPKTFGE